MPGGFMVMIQGQNLGRSLFNLPSALCLAPFDVDIKGFFCKWETVNHSRPYPRIVWGIGSILKLQPLLQQRLGAFRIYGRSLNQQANLFSTPCCHTYSRDLW
jgi:hypothetical protein